MVIEKEIKKRDWNSKVFATPKIPRGKNGMINTIQIVLRALEDKVPYHTKLNIEDSNANTELDYLCIQLRPIGLVIQNYGIWELSDEAKECLENKNDLYLAKIFCNNIKFFAEMIINLKEEKTSKDLYNIAINNYKLGWKTKSDINSRLIWLKEFKLIEYNDYKLTYKLNSKGLEFIKNLEYTKPEEILFDIDTTIREKTLPITEFGKNKMNLTQEELEKRKESIGYIPGNISEFDSTISEYLQLLYNEIDIRNVYDYSKQTFNISESSSKHFISTLTNMDLVDRKTRTIISANYNAKIWLKEKNILDLLCLIHSKFLFFFEILKELENKSLTNKELTSIAKVSYGFTTENIDEIRKRLKILLSSKLIMENGINSFTITERGRKLLSMVSIQEKQNQKLNTDDLKHKNIDDQNLEIENVLTEIRISSRDSTNPKRFEKALSNAFKLLGFEAKWLGGPGNTDILLRTPTTPKFSYKITVDAKTTLNGTVTDGNIDFDTIDEHKKKHNANYSLIVGFKFQQGRVIDRAKEHNVLLISVDELEKIIRCNDKIPLSFSTLEKIFHQSGLVDLSILDNDIKNIKEEGLLMQKIMDCLIEESNDKVTEGILTEKDIYRTLRNCKEFEETPSLERISLMLNFLSSPLIGCVSYTKEGYYAIDSLNTISKKFKFYADSCKNY